MSKRDLVKLDDRELREFLSDNLKVQVATVGKDGTAHLTTLFYVLLDDGRIAFWTYGPSQKIRNLERDPRITCLVEDGTDYFELRGASIKGTAELLRDPDDVFAVGSAVATRMVGAASFDELGPEGEAEVRRQAAKRVAVVVTPERVSSWDHRKMLEQPKEG